MIPVRIRINQWWRVRGKDDAKTACLVAFIVGAFMVAGAWDTQAAEIVESEMRERLARIANSESTAALAALLNGRAITGNNGQWAARCENVVIEHDEVAQ